MRNIKQMSVANKTASNIEIERDSKDATVRTIEENSL